MFRWRQIKVFEQIDPAGIAIAIPRTRASGALRLNGNQARRLLADFLLLIRRHLCARSRKRVNNPG